MKSSIASSVMSGMETYEIKVTEYAEKALREIGTYIVHELKAPEAAVNTLQALRDGIASLNTMPSRVRLTPEEPWGANGIRRMVVRNFYVYFWIDEENLRVQITNVVYTGREQKRQLEAMPME